MDKIYSMSELPRSDLAALGLLLGGEILLEEKDLEALLAGRRSSLLKLKNIAGDGYYIGAVDAKISLIKNFDGELSINLHPIYHLPQSSKLLSDTEQQQLIEGKLSNILKQYTRIGLIEKWLIEFDTECRDFIAIDPTKSPIPTEINGYRLTPEDKETYANGGIVNLPDHTSVQRRFSDVQGITANRDRLILTFQEDGNIAYKLLENIANIYNSQLQQFNAQTPAFQEALIALQQWKQQDLNDLLNFNQLKRR